MPRRPINSDRSPEEAGPRPTRRPGLSRGSPARMRAAARPAAPQGRLLAVPAGARRHPGKTSRSAPRRISRRCRLPLHGRVGRIWRTSTYTTPTRSHPPSSSPPDLTRGHSSREPALRASPVNGDAERKGPSLYARSAPHDPAANKEWSSDRPANHLGLARPDGPTSRTVALTTAHSSRWCWEPAPHHLSPWFRQPIASRVPALGPADWS